MIQIVSGLEMSLVKQYFDDWLVSIKQQDRTFSRTEKKNTKITADTWRAFKLLVAVISLGYNNNLTKNRNISQPTARNLLDISTLNIKFSNESIP